MISLYLHRVWVLVIYVGLPRPSVTGAGLSWPIPVKPEIRQGCPISAELYSLAIKPLLCREFSSVVSHSLALSSLIHGLPTLSAYADDVNIFVSNHGDIL